MPTTQRPPLSSELLQFLAARSRELGADGRLVQGGGGNVSVKDSRLLAVKASGKRLGTLSAEDGFATLEWDPLCRAVAELSARPKPPSRRTLAHLDSAFLSVSPCPSIEVWLHAIVGTAAVHLHPNAVLNLVCRRNWRQTLRSFLRTTPIGCPALLVPYATPGLPLALKLLAELQKSRTGSNPPVLVAFLQNHGLLTVADTIDEAFELATRVTQALDSYLPSSEPEEPAADAPLDLFRELPTALHDMDSNHSLFSFLANPAAARLVAAVRRAPLRARQVYFPDQAVYCGPEMLWLEDLSPVSWQAAWQDYASRWFTEPRVVLHSSGLVALRSQAGQSNLAKIQVLEALLELLHHGTDALHPLTRAQIRELVHWDREAHRQNTGN